MLLVQVLASAAQCSEHFTTLLSLSNCFISGSSLGEHSIDLLEDGLVEGRRLLDSSEQLGTVVPLVNALFNEWEGLVEVGI